MVDGPAHRMNRRVVWRMLLAALAAILAAACSPRIAGVERRPPNPTQSPLSKLELTPYPYSTPLPPANRTPLDGLYRKLEPVDALHTPNPEAGVWMPHPRLEGRRWLKPVPYPLEGGLWMLQLDRGVFHINHPETGWRSFGSFTTSEGRIAFFNDPFCLDAVGRYEWRLAGSELVLELIGDDCDGRLLGGGGLRSLALSGQTWQLVDVP